jgi:hypothetical protein
MNSTMAMNPATVTMTQMLEKVRALEDMVSRPQIQQLDTRHLGTQFARGVSEVLKSHQGMKRAKSPDGAPETPILELLKADGMDDNHKVFNWELRRAYKNPNAKPEDYWAEAKYPLQTTPNLKGNLYLTHLMPLSVSSKALGWLHGAKTQIEIKFFTHSNRTNKRTKKEGLTISSGTDNLGTTNYSVEENWEEADGMKSLVDAIWNLIAATFQIRPWDWTPIVIGRVCHEVGFFSGCSSSREQQKSMTEDFINEVLFCTRTRLGQGSPPLSYHEMLEVAETTVGQANGRQSELRRSKGIYGGRWDLQAKEEEISKLKQQLAQARADANNLRQNAGRGRGGGENSGYSAPRGAARGRGTRGRGKSTSNITPGKYLPGSDLPFEAKRALICRRFNSGTCSDASACNQSHTCNRRAGPGTPCGHGHSAQNH